MTADTDTLLRTIREAFTRGTRAHDGWEDFSAANAALDALTAALATAEQERAAVRAEPWRGNPCTEDYLYVAFRDDLLRVANRTPGFNHDVLAESLLVRVLVWLQRAERAEAALKEIAELPSPLNNKGSALTQCEYLKTIAREALAGSPGDSL